MAYTLERSIRIYLDLIRQAFLHNTMQDALNKCFTLTLSLPGFDVLNSGTWTTTHKTEFETFFNIPTIHIPWGSNQPTDITPAIENAGGGNEHGLTGGR